MLITSFIVEYLILLTSFRSQKPEKLFIVVKLVAYQKNINLMCLLNLYFHPKQNPDLFDLRNIIFIKLQSIQNNDPQHLLKLLVIIVMTMK